MRSSSLGSSSVVLSLNQRGAGSARLLRALAACVVFLCCLQTEVRAELDVPPLKSLVSDSAAVLSPAAAQSLEVKLRAYQRATGHQLAFVSVSALEGEAIESFALRVAEKWKLGDKSRDDGLILLVAKADRKMRIEVGYGLEGAIPDALASQIIRNQLTPAFKKGDFDGGVTQSFSLLMKAAEGESVRVGPAPARGKKRASGIFRLLPFLVLLLLLGGGRRGRGGYGGIAALGMMGAMGGRHRGGFGGGFGGGGGGFGGGGGGGFGGGGASGGW